MATNVQRLSRSLKRPVQVLEIGGNPWSLQQAQMTIAKQSSDTPKCTDGFTISPQAFVRPEIAFLFGCRALQTIKATAETKNNRGSPKSRTIKKGFTLPLSARTA